MNLVTLFNSIKNNINLESYKNIRHLANILKNYDSDDWKKYIINDLSGNKSYNKSLVNETAEFSIYIITWKKHKESKIHNHSSNGCLSMILQGTLIENYYNNKLEYTGFKIVEKNNISYIDNNMYYHNMKNNTDNIAVSLHIYSPSNHETIYY